MVADDSDYFDTVIIGTGFAGSLFLHRYLRKAGKNERILVLEKGKDYSYAWKLKNRTNTDYNSSKTYVNKTPDKPWIQNIAFGGGSCWTGNTPRPHPTDFKMNSLYGVSQDWPFDYDYFEPYLTEAEYIMGISGSNEGPFRRSRGYPQPAHRMNALDRLFAEKYPGLYMPMPTARSSSNTFGRPSCCANGVCATCPITAKFQVDLHLRDIYSDPRVTLQLQSDAQRIEIQNDTAKGVYYIKDDELNYVRADLVVVAAHAIATPAILLRSGLQDHALGRYISEQFSVNVKLDLDGVDNYDGSQAVSGLGVMFHDGSFRTDRPGCYLESWNVPWLRAEQGRWRQRGFIKFVFEDIPLYDNKVTVGEGDHQLAEVSYTKVSDFYKAGLESVQPLMEQLIDGLPVESYVIEAKDGLETDAHIQGTTRMGNDPTSSVVDKHLVHHRVRNLLALGGGAFPSCPSANPTLLLSALSLLAADKL